MLHPTLAPRFKGSDARTKLQLRIIRNVLTKERNLHEAEEGIASGSAKDASTYDVLTKSISLV